MRVFFLLLSTALADPATFLDQLDSPDAKISKAAWEKLEDALNAGPPGPVSVNQHAESIKRVWSKMKPKLPSLRAVTCKTSNNTEESVRASAELIIDLLGSMKGAVPELQFAAQLQDPRLAYFALRSLARQKVPLEKAVIDRVGQNDEMRERLFELLEEEKLPSHFSQEAIARSKLVSWLIYPTELGCAPDEIALGKKLGDFYVYKFRGKDGKWLAGISGPTSQRTFSSFEPWESRTPEQHLQAMVGTLEKWERK